MAKTTKLIKQQLFDYLQKHGKEVPPTCKYFGLCGGCPLQNYDYKDQVKAKKIG